MCFTGAGFSEYLSANVHIQCMIQHKPVLHDVSVLTAGNGFLERADSQITKVATDRLMGI